MKKIFSILLICFLITACGDKLYETIDTNRAIDIINNGAVLIDVRTPDEFSREHITNAVNIPLDQIDSVSYDLSTPIIFYCKTWLRSKEAVEKLSEMGYNNLYNLDGGLLNWGGSLEE